MNSYLFIGRVLPERARFNCPKIEYPGMTSPGSTKSVGNLTVEIKDGRLEANLLTSESFNLATIKNSVEFFLSHILDSFGYCTGQAFDIDIELASGPRGAYTFTPRVNSLFNSQSERPLSPEVIFILAANNMSLLRALGNLREAIKHPVDVGLFCYRAIENIRQHFVDHGKSKNQSWMDMHNALNTTSTFIDNKPSLIDFSEQSRHGETHDISDQDMEKIIHKTWKIVDRFCIFLHENGVPLDEKIYPKLQEI